MERSFEVDRLRALEREAEYRRLRGIDLTREEQRKADDEIRDAEKDAEEAQKRLNQR